MENDTLPALLNPNVLLHLAMASSSTGLFGRTVVVLKQNQGREFGPHNFSIGDLVQMSIPTASLTPKNAEGFPKGIVTKVQDNAISVAFEDLDDVEDYDHQTIRLDRLVNDATYRKLHEGIDALAKYNDGPAMNVLNVIFHGAPPSSNPLPTIVPVNPGMNASQIDAIRFALASKDVALIHGPPGTGKTTTLVELIYQCVTQHKMKVLVCAPSNIAVDNVLEKLAASHKKLRMTRVGHPARLLPQVLQHCLDAKIQSSEGTQIIADIRKELAALKPCRATRQESKLLRKEIREREQKVVGDILSHSDVVLATNAGAATKLLKDMVFDMVVVDEAAQALEVSCWIPLLKGRRCVLAGDHHQLPPTIKCEKAKAGLGLTLFDRLAQMEHTKQVVRMLSTQYRMHRVISDWSSKAMYDNKLESSQAVASRKLQDLPHVAATDLTDTTLLLIDTAGCGLDEDVDDSNSSILSVSKSNQGEAQIVVKHVKALLASGLRPHEVAVITPYNGQVSLLKQLLSPTYPTLEIRSVDGFQGCEKEAVVMSLVRSNRSKQVGFLADDRRMNVAITRAKRHVALVCDTETLSVHPFLKTLIEHFEEHGEYESAQSYVEEETIAGDVASMPLKLEKKAEQAASTSEKKPKAQPVKTKRPADKEQTQPVKAKPAPKDGKEAAKGNKSQPEKKPEHVDEEGKNAEPAAEIVEAGTDEDDEETKGAVEADAPSVFNALQDDDSGSSSDDEPKVPEMNNVLKELHMARLARQPPPPPAPSSKKKKKKKAQPAERLLVKDQVDDKKNEEEDEMNFLDRQIASSNTCAFVSCKQKTHVTGSVCRFCKYKFCYAHCMAEAHGCGTAVRSFEKAKAATTTKPVSHDKRKALQKSLDSKLTKASQDRKPKPKSK
ncbi:unnamed protein product [Aphanomyces euteiches]